ncbi:MAG TPA: YciI family protein [Polyangiaceae bacterium]|nr:YciI family protein [Polyangiaceae bacterium]
MFLVLLKFSDNKAQAAKHMAGHNAWIQRGFDEGIFALVGSLKPAGGGAVVARGITRDALEERIQEDPFVAERVVSAEVIEIAPSRTDERLAFLASGAS